MNSPAQDEAIDPKLVAEVVRVMKEERLIASAATSFVITGNKKWTYGNAAAVAKLAQQEYDLNPPIKRGTPRPYSHADASHRALERMVAA